VSMQTLLLKAMNGIKIIETKQACS